MWFIKKRWQNLLRDPPLLCVMMLGWAWRWVPRQPNHCILFPCTALRASQPGGSLSNSVLCQLAAFWLLWLICTMQWCRAGETAPALSSLSTLCIAVSRWGIGLASSSIVLHKYYPMFNLSTFLHCLWHVCQIFSVRDFIFIIHICFWSFQHIFNASKNFKSPTQ